MIPSSAAAVVRVTLLALVVLATACEQALPKTRYETEHLHIGTTFDAPLCRGDLDHYERVVTTLEGLLDTSLDAPVEVYVWGQQDSAAELGWCEDYATGCFEDGVVYTDLGSVDHELAHALIASLGAPAPFWGEGAAEALQSQRTQPGDSSPLDNLELSPPQLSYLTAGHFSRWLWETHGAERFRALLRAPGSAREAFEAAYPLTIDDAQAQYEAQSPYSYAAIISCDYPDLQQLTPERWSESIELACDESSVRSTPLGMGAYRVLTISSPGLYAFSTTADLGSISRCADETVVDAPIPGDATWGEVPPLKEGTLGRYIHALDLDAGATTLELAPGRYELAVGFSSHDPQTIGLEVTATPGP